MEPSRPTPSVQVVELAPLAVDIARADGGPAFPSEGLQAAVEAIARADAIVASTPVYKAGISGLFKSFVDLLDNDLLVAKPVLLAATAGSSRHALVVDDQMRPLFAYMRALTLPTSVFAAPEDWGPPSSRAHPARRDRARRPRPRADRAADHRSAWSRYQHQFAGNATRAEQSATDIDFDSPLMRLAAGGRTTQDATDSDPGTAKGDHADWVTPAHPCEASGSATWRPPRGRNSHSEPPCSGRRSARKGDLR